MMLKSPSLFAAILILSLFHFTQVLHSHKQEHHHEEEFDYQTGSEKGPENWGKLHKEWAACGEGKMQSPIDLLEDKVEVLPSLGRLYMTYKPAKATLKNRKHDIMLEWEGGAGVLHLNGTKYILKQCHWHSPSEHSINGKRYSMELHMVHESKDNRRVVVGVLYQLGHPESPDPFLAKLMDHLRAIADKNEKEKDAGSIDPMHIKFGSDEYFRYQGSLTTPPCTEGVTWTIFKQVAAVSEEQVKLLRDAVDEGFKENARPKQPINDRTLYMYKPQGH